MFINVTELNQINRHIPAERGSSELGTNNKDESTQSQISNFSTVSGFAEVLYRRCKTTPVNLCYIFSLIKILISPEFQS